MKCPGCSEDLSCYYCEHLIVEYMMWTRTTSQGQDIVMYGTKESIANLDRLINHLSALAAEKKVSFGSME